LKTFPTHANDNAFPIPPDAIAGLTKREYFAAMALQGIVSNQAMIDTINWGWLAKESVAAADELIKSLNQTNA
jgi:hypothetical protein